MATLPKDPFAPFCNPIVKIYRCASRYTGKAMTDLLFGLALAVRMKSIRAASVILDPEMISGERVNLSES
jgi:hypothetical protein